ncbi:MAG: tRNA dihydrouridine synthase DusB [Anaerolineae bacterium]|nr:tRNA dihydrouridine synthase DusB [Anaerolineae bacterium]MDW8170860.1 tRNA dihydrouridine synthase DusB [Anaerolineae bacterium]
MNPPVPFFIGPMAIDPPLTLAPMAGHTHYAFRRLVRELGGCGLVCTELLSSSALYHRGADPSTRQRFDWRADESPIAVQLYGANPHELAEAARMIVDHGATIVDINMGCWVPKVAKKGAGAALLRDVCTATAVVEAVCKAVSVPVTVKVRSGYEDGVVTAVPFAKAARDAGVKAIAVHARFAGQGHTGRADWDVIRRVKEVVPDLPIIGNGDVLNGHDAAAMLAQTGCDGVMVGRGALGRPWVFAQIDHYLRTGEVLPDPPRHERARLALRLARLMFEHSWMKPAQIALELRGQLNKFHVDEPGSALVRKQLVQAESLQQIEDLLLPIVEAGECDAVGHWP